MKQIKCIFTIDQVSLIGCRQLTGYLMNKRKMKLFLIFFRFCVVKEA